jgi:hypothetical protein
MFGGRRRSKGHFSLWFKINYSNVGSYSMQLLDYPYIFGLVQYYEKRKHLIIIIILSRLSNKLN